jgi:hypothetical protein
MIRLNASDSSVILPGTDVRRGTEEEIDHYEYGVRISENYRCGQYASGRKKSGKSETWCEERIKEKTKSCT